MRGYAFYSGASYLGRIWAQEAIPAASVLALCKPASF
jgi:hypothetical protein